jgi:hypothetical protein
MVSSAHFKTPERCICYTVLLSWPSWWRQYVRSTIYRG